MLKQHKKALIISSIIILLPMLVGILLWDHMPDQLPSHWGIDGQADGFSAKAFSVFVVPLILLAFQWLCLWITSKDPKNKKQSRKVTGMVLWIVPCISWFVSIASYGIAVGAEWNFTVFPFLMIGLMFVLIGNYMPKCKQNSTIGIKVSWALANEENWNATHRFAGKIWFTGGIIILMASCLPTAWCIQVIFPAILIIALTPVIYSWRYYQKQLRDGTAIPIKDIPVDEPTKRIYRVVRIFVILILIGVSFLLFSGSIEYTFGENGLVIDPSFHQPVSVSYDAIDSIEYREGNVPGSRTSGLGSFRLLLGFFENEEFGTYTRYTYYEPEACLVLTIKGKTLVLSDLDAERTKALYEALVQHTQP